MTESEEANAHVFITILNATLSLNREGDGVRGPYCKIKLGDTS